MFGIQFTSALFRNRSPRRRETTRYRPVVHGLESRLVPSTFQEFPVPGAPEVPFQEANQVVGAHITTGADGNLWYTHAANQAIGRITPAGAVTEFQTQVPVAILYGFTTGPDGNLWIEADKTSPSFPNDQAFILRMAPDGSQAAFKARVDDAFPNNEDFIGAFYGPTVGPDGNLWFNVGFYAQPDEHVVGRITLDGTVTNFVFPTTQVGDGFFSAGGITLGSDGNLWLRIGDQVRRITPDGQLFGLIAGSHALGEMTTGPDGNIWGVWGNSLERITPDGNVMDFPLPTQTRALGITAGPDGNVWFTEPAANQIGMITPEGQITEYQVPTPNSTPAGITADPDGNVWFTELGSGQIGELVLNDGTGPAAAHGSSPALAQALRTAAADTVFTGTRLDAVNGVGAPPSATATADIGSSRRPLEAVTASQAQPAVANASGLHHQPTHATEAAGIVGLADPLAEIP